MTLNLKLIPEFLLNLTSVGHLLEDVLDPGDEPISPENGASDGEAIDSENGGGSSSSIVLL